MFDFGYFESIGSVRKLNQFGFGSFWIGLSLDHGKIGSIWIQINLDRVNLDSDKLGSINFDSDIFGLGLFGIRPT